MSSVTVAASSETSSGLPALPASPEKVGVWSLVSARGSSVTAGAVLSILTVKLLWLSALVALSTDQ
jgi:hypothetical protein